MNKKLTEQQKKDFNRVLDEVFILFNDRGKFHLTREVDFGQLKLVGLINNFLDGEQSLNKTE